MAKKIYWEEWLNVVGELGLIDKAEALYKALFKVYKYMVEVRKAFKSELIYFQSRFEKAVQEALEMGASKELLQRLQNGKQYYFWDLLLNK